MSASVGGVNSSYSYESNGNRTQSIAGGVVTNSTCDTSNCTTSIGGSPVTHDANGNITSWNGETFTWDARGRLTQYTKPGTTITYSYDPFNMRASKTVNGVTTTYLLDGESVVREVIGGTPYDTLHGPAIDQPLARSGKYFTPNQLGSTTTLTNASGTVVQSYSYGPFGETTGSGSENNPFQYAGRENDGSSLYYNRARYYRPEWGRFISEDPLGIDAGLNQYRYGFNNPLTWVDPAGLDPVMGTRLPIGPEGIVYRPDKRGHAPKDAFGRPINLHHRNQNPDGPIDELTEKQHRRIKHKKGSNVKHDQAWDDWRENKWAEDWDEGRFAGLPAFDPEPSPQLELPLDFAQGKEPEPWWKWIVITFSLRGAVGGVGGGAMIPDSRGAVQFAPY